MSPNANHRAPFSILNFPRVKFKEPTFPFCFHGENKPFFSGKLKFQGLKRPVVTVILIPARTSIVSVHSSPIFSSSSCLSVPQELVPGNWGPGGPIFWLLIRVKQWQPLPRDRPMDIGVFPASAHMFGCGCMLEQ